MILLRFVLLIAATMLFVSCSSISDAQSNSGLNLNLNKSINQPAGNLAHNEKTRSEVSLILTGVIGFNKNRFNFANFQNDGSPERSKIETETKPEANSIIVDIVNCAGYVGSGIAAYNESGWNVEFNQSSAAPDAIEKINICSGRAPKADDIASYGFAIAPFEEKRKWVKIEKPLDLQKAFVSLPIEEQNRVETENGKSLVKSPQLIDEHIANWWTDLNGDGTIDLLAVTGKCLPFADAGSNCEKTWLLINDTWREAATKGYEEIRKIKLYSKAPQILSGAVEVRDGKLSLGTEKGGGIWRNGDSRYGILPIAVATGTVKAAAIVNCAGYLGIVKAVKIHDAPFRGQEDLYSWQLKLIPESIAADAAEKVKKCGELQGKTFNTSPAFALFQFSPDITKAKVNVKTIREPDLKALYHSLPGELKNWLQESEQAEGIEPRAKGTLDAKTDDWADVDGDGKIDLIEVYGGCSGKTSAYICTRIFQLLDGEWKEISFNTPL